MFSYAFTIFLSAFLLFQVQPLAGKKILPWFGGTPAVWTTCMLFFQIVLLAGYAYAHFVVKRLSPRGQMLLHFGLLAATLVFLPIRPTNIWKPTGDEAPTGRILLTLGATIGLPYFLLSSTGPLLQGWFARANPGRSPYRLYALSNAGSLLALVSYPFLFEPNLTWGQQSWSWTIAFGVFILGCGWCAWRMVQHATSEPNAAAAEIMVPAEFAPLTSVADSTLRPNSSPAPIEPPGILRILLWLVLAALGSVMLLATTNMMCLEISPVPLLWILPLALYLLTFVIAFENERWYVRPVAALLLIGFGTWAMCVMKKGPTEKIWFQVAAYAGAAFASCFVCHGELARSKPHPKYLTLFYLMVSLGGALGGVLVAVVCPQVFDGFWELPLGLGAVLCLLMAMVVADAGGISRAARRIDAGVIAAGLVAAMVYEIRQRSDLIHNYPGLFYAICAAIAIMLVATWSEGWLTALRWRRCLAVGLGILVAGVTAFAVRDQGKKSNSRAIYVSRNFFGTLRIFEYYDDDWGYYLQLLNGNIDHGYQLEDKASRGWHTSYYARESGVGQAIVNHPKRRAGHGLRIGVIGLGTGTLASYGEPRDTIRFYDINPAVVELSYRKFTNIDATDPKKVVVTEKGFTYFEDCLSNKTIVQGDARISLELEAERGESQQFDVLAIDAFSSDSIPIHLLTKECLEIYRKHLAPGGVIAFHISSLHLNLSPVVRGLADEFHLHARRIENYKKHSTAAATSDWVLLSKDRELLVAAAAAQDKARAAAKEEARAGWSDKAKAAAEEKDKTEAWDSADWPTYGPAKILWTDDFGSLWQVIDWGGFEGVISASVWIIYFAFMALMTFSGWKVFEKAGEPGWAAIVPIYNTITMLKISGKPWWWIFLFFIPLLNLILAIVALASFCGAYGKGVRFVVGMIFLPFIFLPILAFGDAKYRRPLPMPA